MISWGIQELNELYGEIPENYVLLVEGPPGAGKTSLILHLVEENAKRGLKIFYISLNESPEKLLKLGESIGVNIKKYVREGSVVIDFPAMISSRDLIEYISGDISRKVLEGYNIVVIDSVTPLMKLLQNYGEKRAWLHTVLYRIASSGKTLLVLIADIIQNDPDIMLLEYLSDVVVQLSVEDYETARLIKTMTIKKFRARPTLSTRLLYNITPNGVVLLNYVRQEVVKNIMRKRRPIKIECEPARRIFGSYLYPGTQIFVHVKDSVFPAKCFVAYIQDMLLEASRKCGFKIAVITYNPLSFTLGYDLMEIDRNDLVHQHIHRAGRSFGENLIKIRINPGTTSVDEVLRKVRDLTINENVGAIAIAGIEKAVDMYGSVIEKFSIQAINNMRTLGVIGLRIYTTFGPAKSALATYYRWSDIVLELYVNDRGQSVIKAVKTPTVTKSIEILDEEFCKCVYDSPNRFDMNEHKSTIRIDNEKFRRGENSH